MYNLPDSLKVAMATLRRKIIAIGDYISKRLLQKTTVNKMQSCGAHSNEYIYKTLLHVRLQDTMWKRGWKYFKSQRIRTFAVSLCRLVISEAVPRNSHQHHSLNTSWTRVIPANMINQTEKSQRVTLNRLGFYLYVGTHTNAMNFKEIKLWVHEKVCEESVCLQLRCESRLRVERN